MRVNSLGAHIDEESIINVVSQDAEKMKAHYDSLFPS